VKTGAFYRAGNGDCIVSEAWKTTNPWDRMRGLLGRPALGERQGLLIEPCALVHTFGMGYDLDLVFLDEQLHVRKTVSRVRPFRWAGCHSAHATLELAPGTLDRIPLSVGERLEWRE
jgi:uncharacterized membrane protein (UPF0127 family)